MVFCYTDFVYSLFRIAIALTSLIRGRRHALFRELP